MRDEIMDQGQEMLETAKSRAQEVASELRPELEEKARQVYSDVKQEVKQVAKDAAGEMRPAIDKALEKGKEEARSTVQEMGVNPDNLTGSKSSTSSTSAGSTSGSASMGSSATSSASSMSSGSQSSGSQSKMPTLNRDTLAGQWKQVKGEIKSKWGQLTDDDLTRVEGDYEKLLGSLQTRYGYTRERAENELNDFFSSRKA